MPARTKLIQGTFILTFVGILSRFMGFFFRMFTSHVFGEENIGLYQLIFPVYLFCLSLSTAGIEAAISRTAAQKASRGKYIEAQSILYTGLFFLFFFHNTNATSSEVCPLDCHPLDGGCKMCRSPSSGYLCSARCCYPYLHLRI